MSEQVLEGMGAIVANGGVGFRVWAPHADTVSVYGEFNDWDQQAHPLTRENDEGYWYGFVDGAAVGQQYKYHLTNGDQELDRNDPYAREVTNSVGNSAIVDPFAFDWEDDDYQLPAHNEIVIYEAHVGSFFADDGAGNFAMMAEKLQHVVDLGCNVIQLMPVAEFAGDLSWGYNPAHIFAVESAYGGPTGYREFVKQAHKMGLGVIQDVVYNHFGPSDLDLWQFDGWSDNGKGGIYFYNDHRSSTPWGDTRPDYGRAEVRRFIHDNALMWLREFRVDGLRYDMTPYMRSVDATGFDIIDGWTLQAWINRDIREEFPGALLIAEDMHSNPLVTGFEDDGAGYHAQWDPNFVHPVRKALQEYDDAHRSIDAITEALTYTYDANAFARVIYTESHDEVANGKARVVAEVEPGDQQGWFAQKRSTLGAALVMTAPGIPMLFQGQEFLQGDWFRDDVPLDWRLKRDHHGIVQLYADLITLRRNLFGQSRGLQGQGINVFHRNDDAKVVAFQRWYDHGVGDDVVVVANFSGEARSDYRIGLPSGGRWELKLNSDATLYSDDFGDHPSSDLVGDGEGIDGFGASATLTIAPYSVLVYSYAG